jgi:uncharacterized protein
LKERRSALSEKISADNNRLYEYLEGLHKGNRDRKFYDLYQSDLKKATPWSVNEAIDKLIMNSDDFDKIENTVARFIRAATIGLDNCTQEKYPENHILDILIKENTQLKILREDLSAHFKEFSTREISAETTIFLKEILLQDLVRLQENKSHYLKIQYGLFAAYEECSQQFRCVKLMWQIQDDVLKKLKLLIQYSTGEIDFERRTFNRIWGEMYLKMGALIYREEKILFPVAYRAIPEVRFRRMRLDMQEYGTSFGISKGDFVEESFSNESAKEQEEINLSVGKLLPEQINLMLKNLPLDITFVDENDRVRYYSQGKERIFPRSPGIIGRDVGNCHPPKSVHIVQKIVDDFKSGIRSEAEFWLQMDDQFIHIRYFPLFENGIYKGVIEVSQNITPLRALEGEKKLLDE